MQVNWLFVCVAGGAQGFARVKRGIEFTNHHH
jgi:hypothetical protein